MLYCYCILVYWSVGAIQYAHLYAAYLNSNELAPLETNVIKSHDLELRQDCRGIIPTSFSTKNA